MTELIEYEDFVLTSDAANYVLGFISGLIYERSIIAGDIIMFEHFARAAGDAETQTAELNLSNALTLSYDEKESGHEKSGFALRLQITRKVLPSEDLLVGVRRGELFYQTTAKPR